MGDGHCLLYSAVTSWNAQMLNYPPFSLDELKSALLKEIKTRHYEYESFLDPPNKENLLRCAYRYFNHKYFNDTFGDVMISILSSTLACDIHILDEKPMNVLEIRVILPAVPSIGKLLLHRQGDHFNAIVPRRTFETTFNHLTMANSTELIKLGGEIRRTNMIGNQMDQRCLQPYLLLMTVYPQHLLLLSGLSIQEMNF